MKAVYFTNFILHLSSALDTGRWDHISTEEIKSHIESGDLIDFLKRECGEDIDLGYYELNGEASSALVRGLQELLEKYSGDELGGWGIQNRGLCLLISWTAELIQ